MIDPSATVLDSKYTFIPNPYYFDKSQQHWSKIVDLVIGTPSSLLQALQTGEVEAMFGDSTTDGPAKRDGFNGNPMVVYMDTTQIGTTYTPTSTWVGKSFTFTATATSHTLKFYANGASGDCTSYITGHFGQGAVWTAASPFGDAGWDAPDMSRFFLNRGVGSGTVAPADNTDPFNLPCHAAVEAETVDSFNGAIDGAESAGRWLIFLIHTINPTSQNWYAPIDISVVTGSIAHAK